MCDKEHGIECLHYVVYVGDSKYRPQNVCGPDTLCGEKEEYDDGDENYGDDVVAEIECHAIQKTLGFGAVFVALYLAM